jgi:pilus assembly protein CpaB
MKLNSFLVVGFALYATTIFAQTNEGQGFGVAFKIPQGMRAIAIGAGEVMATGIKPGDHVDLLATYRDPRTTQEVTKVLMQNVLVLAINKGSTDPSRKIVAGGSLTLAVMPEHAELIAAADGAGALRISLRPMRDESIGVTSQSLEKITVPSRPATGDFWLPGEFQKLLEERKQQRRQGSE